jgi:hypothetical protein
MLKTTCFRGLVAALALLLALPALAALTTNQRNTLLTTIKADATAGPFRTAGDAFSLKAWCNAAKSPQLLAWSVAVPMQTSDEAATYTTYDTLVAGKRDSWSIFLRSTRNFSTNKIRAWITDVWGNATAGSVSESILQAGTESATNAQAAIGGSTKTTGTVTATDRTFTGQVDDSDINFFINAP